ncbi:Os08g0519000 [Oryza sativa Japonica Group]|uniref:Os08g0519000 protein n=1 Tax=Oryza sativa subsp. japonica TaxID=39947 RepID=A0A0P0XIZ7_ORYSJ|nr:hypothetical protein EE612_045400 [Oryza sativa]BAT06272.1 Os08g0519000 [Oryza sativa Japonica Group]
MTKNKASTVAEKVPKKPRREDTATADGGPTVEDEPTVVAPGCPEFIGGLVVSFCKRNGSVVLAAHHAPSTEQREGSRKAPCPAGPSFKADPHHTVESFLDYVVFGERSSCGSGCCCGVRIGPDAPSTTPPLPQISRPRNWVEKIAEGRRLLEEGAKELSSSIANSSTLIDAANERMDDL